MNISLQNIDHKPWGDQYLCLDVCPEHDAVHYFCHLVMNVKAYLTFCCSESIFIVTNPYCVTGFDIIQALSSSCDLSTSRSRYYMQTGLVVK
jgi:hypothetical protein